VNYEEFLRHVRKAGLTLRDFADLLRMNRISLSNYAKHPEVPSHLAIIAVLLGECAEHGVDYRSLLLKLDITAKRPRGAARGNRFGGDPQRSLSLENSP